MTKGIKHMGMRLSEEEHDRWHAEHGDMRSEEHEKFLRRMGISKEEDKRWHKAHDILEKASGSADESVNPFAVGGGFLNYCVKQGWLSREGKGRTVKYFSTDEGRKQLKNFGIEI